MFTKVDMAIDMAGKRFGRWTIISSVSRKHNHRAYLKCKCDCGTVKLVEGCSLKRGESHSCGCLKKQLISKRCTKDVTGKRFGRLVAIKPTEQRKCRTVIWECLCDCGNIYFVNVAALRQGKTQSCGCLREELTSKRCTIDITGKRYGRLIVLRRVASHHGQVSWECLCDCGNVHISVGHSLREGFTKSCGCLQEASRWVKNTNINPMDVPFEITDCMKARRDIKKAIKQAS